MEEYMNLSSPLNENGVFVGDGKAEIVNTAIQNLPTMAEYLNSLRQQMEDIDLNSFSNPSLNNSDLDYSKYQKDMNLSFPELLKQEGIKIIVTSGFRPGAKTKQGKVSHHSRKDEWGNPFAIDFRAADGNTDKLLNDIYNNPRIRAWLINHGRGIIEETNKHPDIRKSTGADKTARGGDLLHMGPDKLAIKMSSAWMSYDKITPSRQNIGQSAKSKLNYVKNYLMQNHGLDAIHASALAGIWYAESNLNPSIKSKRDSGSGIAQWTGSRHQEFNKFYRQVFGRQSPGITNVGLEQQIDVAIAEYKARSNNWRDFLNRNNLQGAVDSALRGYENGGGGLASIADMNRIYKGNGYNRQMSVRLGFAQQALQ